MRPWMIVLLSVVGAIVSAAALVLPEVINAPRSEIGPILLAHLPALAVVGLGVYALCAMLLTTATLVGETLRVRHYLARTPPERVPLRRGWIAAFGTYGFRQLASRLVPAPAQSARADGGTVFQTRFSPSETRSEIGRLHYISLARSHFFSALIVLAGIVGLGLAQDHRPLAFLPGTIPTTSAILILIGLALLAILGRIAIDVTAEPLLEAVAQLPVESAEVVLLRRAVELLELVCNAPIAGEYSAPASPAQLPGELVTVIQQGHHALIDAVSRLSTNTQALGAVVRSSVETLETTMRTTAVHHQQTGRNQIVETTAFPELQAAVEELTAVLQRLTTLPPEDPEDAAPDADPVTRRRTPEPRLARQLRKLLQEID